VAYFCPNDGFINILNNMKLDNPRDYLMIPYTELSVKPIKTERIWNGLFYHDSKVPDLLFVTDEDQARIKGWRSWAKLTYGPKWEKLKQINSKTGSDFKW
jgi:hypothetical protein